MIKKMNKSYKRNTKKRKFCKVEHLRNSTSHYVEKTVEIVTISHSDKTKQYTISLNDSMELCCTCGEVYNDPCRKNCRHISLLLIQLYGNFTNSLITTKNRKIDTDLHGLIEKFNKMLN